MIVGICLGGALIRRRRLNWIAKKKKERREMKKKIRDAIVEQMLEIQRQDLTTLEAGVTPTGEVADGSGERSRGAAGGVVEIYEERPNSFELSRSASPGGKDSITSNRLETLLIEETPHYRRPRGKSQGRADESYPVGLLPIYP